MILPVIGTSGGQRTRGKGHADQRTVAAVDGPSQHSYPRPRGTDPQAPSPAPRARPRWDRTSIVRPDYLGRSGGLLRPRGWEAPSNVGPMACRIAAPDSEQRSPWPGRISRIDGRAANRTGLNPDLFAQAGGACVCGCQSG